MKHVFYVVAGIFSLEYDVYIELFFSYFFNVAILYFLCFYFDVATERPIHRTSGRQQRPNNLFVTRGYVRNPCIREHKQCITY